MDEASVFGTDPRGFESCRGYHDGVHTYAASVMMPRKDPEAQKAYHREYMRRKYQSDPVFKEKHLARIRRNDDRYRLQVEEAIGVFRSKGCHLCPETDLCCLVAHHTNPTEKDFNIGDAKRDKFSPHRVRAELAKCVCVCMNCHARIHAGVLQLV